MYHLIEVACMRRLQRILFLCSLRPNAPSPSAEWNFPPEHVNISFPVQTVSFVLFVYARLLCYKLLVLQTLACCILAPARCSIYRVSSSVELCLLLGRRSGAPTAILVYRFAATLNVPWCITLSREKGTLSHFTVKRHRRGNVRTSNSCSS